MESCVCVYVYAYARTRRYVPLERYTGLSRVVLSVSAKYAPSIGADD